MCGDLNPWRTKRQVRWVVSYQCHFNMFDSLRSLYFMVLLLQVFLCASFVNFALSLQPGESNEKTTRCNASFGATLRTWADSEMLLQKLRQEVRLYTSMPLHLAEKSWNHAYGLIPSKNRTRPSSTTLTMAGSNIQAVVPQLSLPHHD